MKIYFEIKVKALLHLSQPCVYRRFKAKEWEKVKDEIIADILAGIEILTQHRFYGFVLYVIPASKREWDAAYTISREIWEAIRQRFPQRFYRVDYEYEFYHQHRHNNTAWEHWTFYVNPEYPGRKPRKGEHYFRFTPPEIEEVDLEEVIKGKS